jgi:myo-inositol 2-dehydrogenase / D-chiro-inositol 1-dehydrogenase
MSTLNRRSFLSQSVAASSAAAFISRSALGQTGEMIGTGMIGVGNRGSYLLKAVLDQPGVKVMALCDLKPDRLDKAATAAVRDQPATLSDYRKLLERKDIQAVFIATPCDLHVEMAIAALQAGKNVYCEKPAGITPESIRELLKVAKAHPKLVYQPGQQMRSDRKLQAVVQKIHEGVAGKVVMVRAQRHSGDDLDHNGPSADWFFNAKRSGDVIVEMAVHNLDVCNWVTNSHPDKIAGFGGALVWPNDPVGRTNMDGYTLSYEQANGVKMAFAQTFFHPYGMPGGNQSFAVYGTEGAVDLSSGTYYPLAKGAKPVVLFEAPAADSGHEKLRDAHISAFYESIRTGKKGPADVVIGATAALTAIAGREAIYRKRMMTWRELGVEI